MSWFDHAAADLDQALADGDGPHVAATVTVPGGQAVACRVMVDERPASIAPDTRGNSINERIAAITIPTSAVADVTRQTTVVIAAPACWAGTWRVRSLEIRGAGATVALCALDTRLAVRGQGVSGG